MIAIENKRAKEIEIDDVLHKFISISSKTNFKVFVYLPTPIAILFNLIEIIIIIIYLA